jgi:hypothetical protein
MRRAVGVGRVNGLIRIRRISLGTTIITYVASDVTVFDGKSQNFTIGGGFVIVEPKGPMWLICTAPAVNDRGSNDTPDRVIRIYPASYSNLLSLKVQVNVAGACVCTRSDKYHIAIMSRKSIDTGLNRGIVP